MKSLLNQKTGALEIEDCGDIILASDFWDCECDKNYIKEKSQSRKCNICGTREEEMPDSRLNELLAQYPHLKDFHFYQAQQVDKSEIFARIKQYEERWQKTMPSMIAPENGLSNNLTN